MSEQSQPNRDQAAAWNDGSGKTWVDMQPITDRLLAPFEAVLMEEGFPGAGGAVLDIGCGAGATTLAMAKRLGPGGLCVGVDISAPLIAAAKARPVDDGMAKVAFVEADAQTHAFEPATFDAVISRFGVMFFDDPVVAFANIRQAAKRGAKLAFIAWRSAAENAFMTAAARAAAPFLPDLPAPVPDAPGPFGFADGDRVRRILDSGGWSSVEVRPIDVPCTVGEGDLFAYITRLGPVGAALRSADDDTRAKVIAVLPAAFAPFVEDGMARFNAACWLVRASA